MATILVVDDDEALRAILARLLARASHAVTAVEDGNAALVALENAEFDLVITDLVMPDKEGIETIRDIRKRWPAQKIIAMSGGPGDNAAGYLRVSRHLGAAATLAKPFSSQVLLDTVRDVLAGIP